MENVQVFLRDILMEAGGLSIASVPHPYGLKTKHILYMKTEIYQKNQLRMISSLSVLHPFGSKYPKCLEPDKWFLRYSNGKP